MRTLTNMMCDYRRGVSPFWEGFDVVDLKVFTVDKTSPIYVHQQEQRKLLKDIVLLIVFSVHISKRSSKDLIWKSMQFLNYSSTVRQFSGGIDKISTYFSQKCFSVTDR